MPNPNCQQPELGSAVELGDFPSQLSQGSQILPTWISQDTLPALPSPDCAREKVGQGGGKGGAEGLNKTDQKALHFSPNTQLFND